MNLQTLDGTVPTQADNTNMTGIPEGKTKPLPHTDPAKKSTVDQDKS